MAKKRKKGKRVYQGAIYSRLTSDWVTSSTSADSEIYTALRSLRNRSRDLVRNNDYIAGAVNTIANNVIGEGIGFQSQVKKRRKDELDDKTNQKIEDAWHTWSECGCDVTGRLSLPDIEHLMIRSLIESGEVLVKVVFIASGDSNIPFSLEIIEADQLCDDFSLHNHAENMVKMGVELNDWGKPVAYHLYPYHPGDYQFQASFKQSKLLRVEADQVFHLYLCNRPGQTRGVPWLASSLIRSKHLAGFEEAELVKARAQAAYMGFIQSPDPTVMSEVDEQVQPITELSPGEIVKLAPGELFQGFAPTSPGQQFSPFVQMMLRGMAAGLGLSYESLSHDYSNTSYSSARQSILEERDNYKRLQAWFIRSFLKPLFKKWLEIAVMSGALELPDFEINREYYRKPHFYPRRWQWVDPSKDISAKVTEIDNNVTSLTSVIAETGRDIEEILTEKAREKRLLEQMGLVEKVEEDPIIKSSKQWQQWDQLTRMRMLRKRTFI